jgi:hypothetical protein
MKITSLSVATYVLLILFSSCATSAYITDQESVKRQKEMRKHRTGINFAEAGLLFASAVGEAFTGVNIYPEPTPQSFRKMILVNDSKDTLFINMVTDWLWKDSVYCDIREIVMPPRQSAKVVVPMGIAYNVFFRNDFNAPDDEKVEINTAEVRRLKLSQGIEKSKNISGN